MHEDFSRGRDSTGRRVCSLIGIPYAYVFGAFFSLLDPPSPILHPPPHPPLLLLLSSFLSAILVTVLNSSSLVLLACLVLVRG